MNLDLICGRGVADALIDALSFGPLFFPERYDRSNAPKKYKSDQNLAKSKKNKK